MRLIRASDLTFKDHIGRKIPPYAIISHRWREDTAEEVSYQEFLEEREDFLKGLRNRYGWVKISQARRITLERDLEWFWIDTCCIDKKSSAELSEAINSMFKWYRKSKECYVFLEDVHPVRSDPIRESEYQRRCMVWPGMEHSVEFDEENFKKSVWHSRAWTLQELLAPREMYFFNSAFRQIGSKSNLQNLITDRTGIDGKYLSDTNGVSESLSHASIVERMRWGSQREATKEEDIAYSLLGIFNVNMPLLYGEGSRAFMRLQHEIMKISDDDSILAWSFGPEIMFSGLLAPRISCFSESFRLAPGNCFVPHDVVPNYLSECRRRYEETARGTRFSVWLPSIGSEDFLLGKTTNKLLIPLSRLVRLPGLREERPSSGPVARGSREEERLEYAICIQLICWRLDQTPTTNTLTASRCNVRPIVIQRPGPPGSLGRLFDRLSTETDSMLTDGPTAHEEYIVYVQNEMELDRNALSYVPRGFYEDEMAAGTAFAR